MRENGDSAGALESPGDEASIHFYSICQRRRRRCRQMAGGTGRASEKDQLGDVCALIAKERGKYLEQPGASGKSGGFREDGPITGPIDPRRHGLNWLIEALFDLVTFPPDFSGFDIVCYFLFY